MHVGPPTSSTGGQKKWNFFHFHFQKKWTFLHTMQGKEEPLKDQGAQVTITRKPPETQDIAPVLRQMGGQEMSLWVRELWVGGRQGVVCGWEQFARLWKSGSL